MAGYTHKGWYSISYTSRLPLPRTCSYVYTCICGCWHRILCGTNPAFFNWLTGLKSCIIITEALVLYTCYHHQVWVYIVDAHTGIPPLTVLIAALLETHHITYLITREAPLHTANTCEYTLQEEAHYFLGIRRLMVCFCGKNSYHISKYISIGQFSSVLYILDQTI